MHLSPHQCSNSKRSAAERSYVHFRTQPGRALTQRTLTEHAYHQKMGAERRQDKLRVRFSQPVSVWIMGIDGIWRRSCSMEDISDTGAKLTVEGALDGLQLKEFFLLLSSTGLAYRRCELVWVHGEQIGISFLQGVSLNERTLPSARARGRHAALQPLTHRSGKD